MQKDYIGLTNFHKKYIQIFLFCFFTLPGIKYAFGTETIKQLQEPKDSIANWEKMGPGGGGSTFIPTFSYQSPNKFLVKCDMTGTYLTSDGGISYHQINFAGESSAFAFDPQDPKTIYIGGGFLNRSTDGGKTWKQIFPAKTDIESERYLGDHAMLRTKVRKGSLYNNQYRIQAIRVDLTRSGTIYMGMGPLFLYSSNAGKTWKSKNLHEHINYIYTNSSSAKNEIFIFTAGSIWVFNKSTNKFTYKALSKAMSPAFSFTAGTLAKTDKIIFYALHHDPKYPIEGEFGHTELWRCEDKGHTWKQITDSLLTNTAAGISPSYSMVSCAESDAGKAYLISNRYEDKKNKKIVYWYGALKTNDAGNSWNWVWKGGGGSGQYGVKDGVGVSNLKDAWVEKAFGGEYIRLIDVGVAPFDGNIAIVTDWYRTMKTMDGGKTWNQIYSFEQADGSFSSNGMDVTTCYGVHFDPFDSNHIAISYTDIGYHHSYNRGKSWMRSANGVPPEWVNTCYWAVFDPKIKGKIWSAWSGLHDLPRGKMTRNPSWKETARGGICISTDGGKKWKPANDGMGFNSPATSIVLDPKSPPGNRTLYASVYNKGVFKSVDDGKTWKLKNNGLGKNTCAFKINMDGNGNLFLIVSPTPVFKDGKKGREIYSGAVYKSTDGAETWTRLNVNKGLLFPNGIDFDPRNPNRIYLACWSDIELSDLVGEDVTSSTGGDKILNMPGGIFLSENGGRTWKQILDERKYVYDVTVDSFHPGRIYCNTFNRAAYCSEDYGRTWRKIKGYDFHWGHRIIVDKNEPEKIFITTFGSSVWHGTPLLEKNK